MSGLDIACLSPDTEFLSRKFGFQSNRGPFVRCRPGKLSYREGTCIYNPLLQNLLIHILLLCYLTAVKSRTLLPPHPHPQICNLSDVEASARGCRSLIDLRYFGSCRFMIKFHSNEIFVDYCALLGRFTLKVLPNVQVLKDYCSIH